MRRLDKPQTGAACAGPARRRAAHLRDRLPRAHRARSRRRRGSSSAAGAYVRHTAPHPVERDPGLLRSRLQTQRRRRPGGRAADHPAGARPARRLRRARRAVQGLLDRPAAGDARLPRRTAWRTARASPGRGARGMARRLRPLVASRGRVRRLRSARRRGRRQPRRPARRGARPALHGLAPTRTRPVAGCSHGRTARGHPTPRQ